MSDFFKDIFTWIPFDVELGTVLIFILFSKTLTTEEVMAAVIIFVSWLMDVFSDAITFSYHPFWLLLQEHSNLWFPNYSMPIIFALYAILYFYLFRKLEIKWIVVSGFMFFLLLHVVNLLYYQGYRGTASNSLLAGQLLIGALAFLYLRHVVETSDESPFRNFMFWFSAATLLSNFVTAPVTSLLSWLPSNDPKVFGALYSIIGLYIGYYLSYLIIIIGLLWTRKRGILFFQ
ncbi:MAG TPA: hypothetical protein VE978_25785 [Chitinophagales bacterium]|nr:hypothetical protein [Chitinophagales bacterium]